MKKSLIFILILCVFFCFATGVSANVDKLEFSATESSTGEGYTWTVHKENNSATLALSWAELEKTLVFPADIDTVIITLDGISSIDCGSGNCIEANSENLMIKGDGVLNLSGLQGIFCSGNLKIQNGHIVLYNNDLLGRILKDFEITGGYIEGKSGGSGFNIGGSFKMSAGVLLINLTDTKYKYYGIDINNAFELTGGWLEIITGKNSIGMKLNENSPEVNPIIHTINGSTIKICAGEIAIEGVKADTKIKVVNSIGLISIVNQKNKALVNVELDGVFLPADPFPDTPIAPELPVKPIPPDSDENDDDNNKNNNNNNDNNQGGNQDKEENNGSKDNLNESEGEKDNPVPGPNPIPFKNPFIDVKEKDYFYDAVMWAAQNGIVYGTSKTEFSPQNHTTRGQMITFLWRLMGYPEPKSVYCPFTDVKSSDYYGEAVLWGYENGYIAGVSPTSFSPDSPVTRGQAVTFLARISGVKDRGTEYRSGFKDVKSNAYYANAVGWAKANGIVAGVSDTSFAPDTSCRRCDMVCIIYRWQNKIR